MISSPFTQLQWHIYSIFLQTCLWCCLAKNILPAAWAAAFHLWGFNLVYAAFCVTIPSAVRPNLLRQMDVGPLTCTHILDACRTQGGQCQPYTSVHKSLLRGKENLSPSLTLPRQGIEPRVFGLKDRHSTSELQTEESHRKAAQLPVQLPTRIGLFLEILRYKLIHLEK